MKSVFKLVLVVLALCALATCGSKFRTYSGPVVTSVEVHKADRKMYLLHGTQILKAYDIHLGGAPSGPKHFEGDGKTPEGSYFISHRNGQSTYHLSLGISYPNDIDRAYAAAQGMAPGGDIFIHGQRQKGRSRGDWTVGCIAVTDRQIEEIYAMVNPGTPINIYP
jgi:murein L,D-transpeptidase YafK